METQTIITNKVQINPFESVFCLANQVKIFIPSTLNATEKTDNSKIIDEIASKLSELNGGATISNGQGCWNSDTFGLIKEDVTIITSSCESINYSALYDIAYQIKIDMNQESVAVEINGKLYLV